MLVKAWSCARALSLDVVAGGACGASLACSVTGAPIRIAALLSLGAAIWVVYTIDHLLDARRQGGGAAAPRHALHRAHARPLAAAAGIAALSGALLAVMALPARLLELGAALGLLSALHLANAQRPHPRLVPKELSAAAVYTAGVWAAALAGAPRITGYALAAIGSFFLAATSNLLLYTLLEADYDARTATSSAVGEWGEAAVARAIHAFAGTAAAVALVAAWSARLRFHGAFAVLIVLGLVPSVLLRWRSRVLPGERYRLVGDLAFVLGAIPAILRG